jgi:hypothetical protein
VVRRCVWSRNLVIEEDMAHWWLSRQKRTNKIERRLFICTFSSYDRLVILHVRKLFTISKQNSESCRQFDRQSSAFIWLYDWDILRFEILSDKVLLYVHCGFTGLRIITVLFCIYVLFKKVSLHQP